MATVVSTRMLSVLKEELPTVANELAASARSSTSAALESGQMAVRAGEEMAGMNPVVVRQMAEMSVKEVTAGESSILSQHLSLRSALHPPPSGPTSLLESIPNLNPNLTTSASASTIESTLASSSSSISSSTISTSTSTSIGGAGRKTTSIIAQTLEKDAGVSIKEAISNVSNAGQTGLEEVVEQLGETGRVLLEGGGARPPVLKPDIALV